VKILSNASAEQVAICARFQSGSTARSDAMKFIFAHAAAIILATGLSGCDLDVPPISSAKCTTYVAGSPGPQKELTSAQLHALNAWLSGHRSEWSRTAVTHAPRIMVLMQHKDGESAHRFRPIRAVSACPHSG
jgi:hypothetical protein